MDQRAFGDLPPVGVELGLGRRDGVGQKLQDVFLRDPVAVVVRDAAGPRDVSALGDGGARSSRDP
jgi:hypothetical protein